MANETYLPARPCDAELSSPPPGVTISLFGLVKADHWSECIIEDDRPPIKDSDKN